MEVKRINKINCIQSISPANSMYLKKFSIQKEITGIRFLSARARYKRRGEMPARHSLNEKKNKSKEIQIKVVCFTIKSIYITILYSYNRYLPVAIHNIGNLTKSYRATITPFPTICCIIQVRYLIYAYMLYVPYVFRINTEFGV